MIWTAEQERDTMDRREHLRAQIAKALESPVEIVTNLDKTDEPPMPDIYEFKRTAERNNPDETDTTP
jgi:hypothetical protein